MNVKRGITPEQRFLLCFKFYTQPENFLCLFLRQISHMKILSPFENDITRAVTNFITFVWGFFSSASSFLVSQWSSIRTLFPWFTPLFMQTKIYIFMKMIHGQGLREVLKIYHRHSSHGGLTSFCYFCT